MLVEKCLLMGLVLIQGWQVYKMLSTKTFQTKDIEMQTL